MVKTFATLLATLVVAGAAHAQQNPPGSAAPPHTPGVATGKSEMRGEAKKEVRESRGVAPKVPVGDSLRTHEGSGGIASGRAADRSQRNLARREAAHPGATPVPQGGTPK